MNNVRILKGEDRHFVYHHHHQVARTKRIAVSTMRRQEGRSVARRNAECSPVG